MKKPFRERYSVLIILSIFILIGLYFFASRYFFGVPFFILLIYVFSDSLLIAYLAYKTAKNSKLWPTTSGLSISAYNVRQNRANGGSHWTLKVEYSYCVIGAVYSGNNYTWLRISSGSQEKIEKITNNINSTPNFKVSYNPENHSQSVMVPTAHTLYYYLIMLITLALTVLFLGFLLDHLGLISLADILQTIKNILNTPN